MKVFSPVRIGFLGGGTDLPFFYQDYGGKVLNASLNFGWEITLIEKKTNKIDISFNSKTISLKLDKRALHKDDDFVIVRAVLNHFLPLKQGFSLNIKKTRDLTGLGSSGSLLVGLCFAFSKLLGKSLSKRQLAGTAFTIESKLGLTGKQDAYIASFGGIRLFSFEKDETVNAQKLNLPDIKIKKLLDRLVLVYVGGLRESYKFQRKLAIGATDKKRLLSLFNLKKQAEIGAKFLEMGDLDRFGTLLHKSWHDKKASNPSVTNERIDSIYNHAIRAGALGGKLCGAGGGGHMFFLCKQGKKESVISGLGKLGLNSVNFKFDFLGVRLFNKRKVIFFDRDGVLIKDPGYLSDKKNIEILPGVIDAFKKLKAHGFEFVIVGNQSSIARRIITAAEADRLNLDIANKFSSIGVNFLATYYCPHSPKKTKPCLCRKPKPGLFLQAERELGINMGQSFVIGDKPSDIEAGKRAKCGYGILVKRNFEVWDMSQGDASFIDYKANNINLAVEKILRNSLKLS